MNEQTVLFDLLKEGVSPTHVVKSCEKRLKDAGFEKIAYEKEWNLKAGGREFDTLKSKKVPQSLEIGLFFCQIFIFII